MWQINILFLICCSIQVHTYTPIVLWHGMGDTCCAPDTMGVAIKHLKDRLPSVYIHSIQIGNSTLKDYLSGYFMHPDKQIAIACKTIQSDPNLKNGYNAIGLSQGSQFLRGLAQRCPEPKMKNYVSLGGQHQGVYGFPYICSEKQCNILAAMLTRISYHKNIQRNVVQATFWHDSKNETAFMEKNTFIADINNENSINEDYITNLQSLENMIFVKYEKDQMVIPRESQWFGFYKPYQTKEIAPLQDLRVYDRLGLRKMDEDGKLHFLSTPGGHIEMPVEWFMEEVIDKFFK